MEQRAYYYHWERMMDGTFNNLLVVIIAGQVPIQILIEMIYILAYDVAAASGLTIYHLSLMSVATSHADLWPSHETVSRSVCFVPCTDTVQAQMGISSASSLN